MAAQYAHTHTNLQMRCVSFEPSRYIHDIDGDDDRNRMNRVNAVSGISFFFSWQIVFISH